MFRVVKSVEPVFPVVDLSQVERLVTRENKILVSVYENKATFLIRDDKVFFYAFGIRNTHSKSNTIGELLDKQHPLDGSSELYLFDSLKEFFECATNMEWRY
jgi:hypothetical protein